MSHRALPVGGPILTRPFMVLLAVRVANDQHTGRLRLAL